MQKRGKLNKKNEKIQTRPYKEMRDNIKFGLLIEGSSSFLA